MKMKKLLVGVIALVMMLLLLTACEKGGTSVTEAMLDSNNHIIVKFSDGSVADFGAVSVNVNDVKSIDVDEEKHAIVTYSDGSTKDLGYVGVVDESKNKIVTQTEVNTEKHLIVTYSDGSTEDMGYVGVVDESKNKIVTKTEVNTEKHLIITYSDGTTEDKGYVGVEVIPELYIVRFLDLSENLLSEQEVYAGRGAKAPAAPVVADKTFSNWDTDFTNVQSNLTIRPVYTSAATYTVTFKDTDGTILKTEQVISGHSATAPTPPKKENDIFVEWDKSFAKITSDLIVTAKYRAKKTLTVTFKDYTGVTLGTAQVKEGNTAAAPVTPIREGYSFTGWSSSLNNITSDITVTAQYRILDGTNIFDISYIINSNNTLTVTYAVKGSVKFCGMEGNITIPAGLTYSQHTDGDGATSNYKDGKLYFMFSSNNGKDITSPTTIITVVYNFLPSVSSVNFITAITDMYDQNFENVSYKIIGNQIKIK